MPRSEDHECENGVGCIIRSGQKERERETETTETDREKEGKEERMEGR